MLVPGPLWWLLPLLKPLPRRPDSTSSLTFQQVFTQVLSFGCKWHYFVPCLWLSNIPFGWNCYTEWSYTEGSQTEKCYAEWSQTEKDKYCMISLICGIWKNGANEPIYKTEIESWMVTYDYQGGKAGRDKLGAWDWHIHTTATASTTKSLQSCPALCDPIDGSPPGSAVPGILQARTLEWVAISFSNAGKWKSESEVAQLCPTLSDPMDCSLPGSSIHGIFQARVLEWGAIAFSLLYIK